MRKPRACAECAYVTLKPVPEFERYGFLGEYCGRTEYRIIWDMRDEIPETADCPIPEGGESQGEKAAEKLIGGEE